MEKNYQTGDISIDIPETFIKEIFEYNDKFVESQKETIRKIITNIDLDSDNNPTKEQIKNAKRLVFKI